MSLKCLGILLLALLLCAGGAEGANFKIGVNLPFETASLGTAVTNLVKFLQVNEVDLATIDQTGTHTFSLVYTATNYTTRNSTLAMQDAISTHNVLGVVGDWTSSNTIPQSLAGSRTYTWMCSGAASSSVLSDKSNHAFFFRTMCDDPSQGRIIAQFVKSLGWGTASVIASSDAYGQSVSGTFLQMARTLGIQVAANQVFQPGQADFSVVLDAVLNSGSQIIVLSALADSSRDLLRQARARGMISPEWVWIGPENMASFSDIGLTAQEMENVDGMLYVYPREKTYSARFNTSVTRFKAAYPSLDIPAYSFLFNDCVEALARGILKIAREKSVADLYNRNYFPNLTYYFLNQFEGLTGQIDYDDNGNRKAYFNVFNWYKGVSSPVYDVLPDLSVVQRTPITFFGGSKTIPKDRPQQVPLVPYLDSPAGVGLAAGNGIVIAIVVLTWAYLFAARNQPSVRSLSFPFLSLICVGCVLVLASNIAALGSPTAVGCQTSLWLFCWGLELVLASSAAKAYRLFRIFDNKVISAGKVANKYLLAGVLTIILGQTIILIIWTAGGPQQAIMVSSRTYYFFRCESAVTSFNTALSAVTIVYNVILLIALLFLAYKTRGIASNFNESTWMFYTGQNILLTGIVVAAFAFFSFGDSSLAAFIVKQVTIIYSVAFAFAALVGRIAVAVYATNGFTGLAKLASSVAVLPAGKDNQGSSTRGGALSTQAPGGEGNMKVSMIDGTTRISSMRGTYPVKKTGGLMSTWISHNVGFHAADGFFSLIPSKIDPELGVILRLNTIHFDPAPTGMKACIEVSAKGKGWMIQFPTDEEREKWVSVLATTSTSKKGSTTGGGTAATGGGAQSGSPLRASPSNKLGGANSQNALG